MWGCLPDRKYHHQKGKNIMERKIDPTHEVILKFFAEPSEGTFMPKWMLNLMRSQDKVSNPHLAAVFLGQLVYWLKPKKVSKTYSNKSKTYQYKTETSVIELKTAMFEGGSNWVYKTVQEWVDEIGGSDKTFRRMIEDLCGIGLLIKKTQIRAGKRRLCLTLDWGYMTKYLLSNEDPFTSLTVLKCQAEVLGDWGVFLDQWEKYKAEGVKVGQVMSEEAVGKLRSKRSDRPDHPVNMTVSYTETTTETTYPTSPKKKILNPTEEVDAKLSRCLELGDYLFGDIGPNTPVGSRMVKLMKKLIKNNTLTPELMEMFYRATELPEVRDIFTLEKWSEFLICLDRDNGILGSFLYAAVNSPDCPADLKGIIINSEIFEEYKEAV
jgi:hypothetical protein